MDADFSTEEMLEILEDRASKLLDEKSPKDAMRGRLLAEIANLNDELKLGPVTQERWEDHELLWQEHVTDLRTKLVASMSGIMLGLEALARDKPETITPELAELLAWWQNENGREGCLGELPLEQRRALEEETRKYPRAPE